MKKLLPAQGRILFPAAVLTALLAVLFLFPVRVQAKMKVIPDRYGPEDVFTSPAVSGLWLEVDDQMRFLKDNDKFLKKAWFTHQGKVYLVNKNGWQVHGWVSYRGNTYYLRKTGDLLTGWLKKTYYFRPDNGRMIVSGTYRIGGSVYYFKDGKKQTGLVKGKTNTYYFLSSGKMAENRWVTINGKVYRFGENGAMLKNTWLTLNGKKYYLGSDGARLTGTQTIEGKTYTFRSDGVLQENASSIDPDKPMVALTFDDGPSIYTPRLLSILQKNKAKATFFMMGDRVLTYASSVQQMAQAGFELGNHSMTHTAMTTLPIAKVQEEFSTTSSNIFRVTGQYPTVARLPYGDGYNSASILAAIGLPSIYWSLDTEDWKNTGNSQATVDAVLGNVKAGDIILMHDLYAATVNAAEVLIPALISRGYQLVTVSEMARYRWNTALETGRTYFHFY